MTALNQPASTGVLPLAGVRVLDMSRILAGPTCAMVLGDLGAEVIKLEHPARGDDTRDWGTPIGATQTAYFNSVNRNKSSVGIDLQTAEGVDLVKRLAAVSDVVVQNFKVGGAAKLGVGYEQLQEVNPKLIYCSISGYPVDGDEAKRPGYDLVVQGEAGLMALNGEADQPPLKFGVAVVDMFTGMYAAQAVLAALHERHRTGRGRRIEMALFECGLALTSYYGLEALVNGQEPPRYGNAHPSIVPYGVFDAQDGPLVITVGNNAQFARFCIEVIDRPALAEDERFGTNVLRSKHRAALVPMIEQALRQQTRAQLLTRLNLAGIPCGEVLGLHEALSSTRVRASGMVTQVPHPEVGSTAMYRSPYRFDGAPLAVRRAPPLLGAGTAEVLGDLLGLDTEAQQALREKGVI